MFSMAKYTLKECGYGKYKHLRPIQISDAKARKLEERGDHIFDNKEQALNKARSGR